MRRYASLNRAILIVAVAFIAVSVALAIAAPRVMEDGIGPWKGHWHDGEARIEGGDGEWARGYPGHFRGRRYGGPGGPGLFGLLVVGGIVYVLVRGAHRHRAWHTWHRSGGARGPEDRDARETLRDRYADGAVDTEEYRARMRVLDDDEEDA